jgi:inner membrane protein
MPTVFTHSFVGAITGYSVASAQERIKLIAISLLCGSLPDIDAAAFVLHIPYASMWGHRGFTHSIVFALMAALMFSFAFFKSKRHTARVGHTALFFGIILSHGLLDAMTNGGQGVAFLSPFMNERFFFPWTPIKVAPIGIRPMFTKHGFTVFENELLFVWLPLSLLAACVKTARWLIGSAMPVSKSGDSI